MFPARRLLFLLLLLALHAGPAQAAPWRARGGDEAVGNDYPASWLDAVSEPLRYPGAQPVGEADPGSRLGSRTELPGHAVDDHAGRTFQAPRQRAGLQPGWRRRGLPRPRNEAERGKKAPEPSKLMRQLLDELHRAHEMNREAVWKEAFPEGSRSSLPGSGEAAEAMPAAGMPGLPRPGAYQHSRVNESHTTNSGTERLGGVHEQETRPKTRERLQALPTQEKRQTGRTRLMSLLRGPDSVPCGCGSWTGGQSWGWHFCPCPSKERLVKQLRSPRAVLLAFWVLFGGTTCPKGWESCPRGWDGASRQQHPGKPGTHWPY
ncbi:uncharacterized protein LOC135580439 [Columba livia]|uniref:uncharacterized protein LOC135580439 n=1 Tax=Columba livia TaxID=8932 RepID=UPI0031BB2E5C